MTDVQACRPLRADLAARYDLGVDSYVALWSPVILPPARSVIAALDLRSARRVLDVGTGSGALVPHVRAAAPDAIVIGVDPSRQMVRAAQDTVKLAAVQGDAMSLPLCDRSLDAALLAYMLRHLDDPAAAMDELPRVVTAGGVVGTATWMHSDSIRAPRC